MSSLIVLLPREPADAGTEFAFALTGAAGTGVEDHGTAAAALLPQARGAGAEVIAVVPVNKLSWHRVELPKGTGAGSPRLRAVLEGLLEDQLLDETDQLHFAVQPQARGGQSAWVAVCDRAWLRGCLQLLESAGRAALRVVPEFAPAGAPQLTAMGETDAPLLVASGEEGVLALPLAPASLALLPAEGIARVAEPAVAAQAEQLLQQPFTLQQAPQRWLQAAHSPWDLAQGEFASSGRARALKRLATRWSDLWRAPQWRPARWGAAALVALNLIGLNAWAWKERSALQSQRESLARTLTTTFPSVKVVVDPVTQMEREVALLRQRAGVASGRDLESMLAALAQAVPPGVTVGAMEFNGNELRLRGLPVDPAALGANLRGLGYGVTQQGDALIVTTSGSAP
jgi:general secretion pathway protein L